MPTTFTEEQQIRRAQIIAETYREWVADLADVTPDPEWSGNDPSQYPETAEALSAPLEDQIDLRIRTLNAFASAGLLTPGEQAWLEEAQAQS